MSKVNEYLKTTLLVILLLQFIPPILQNIKDQLIDNLEPKNFIGLISMNDCIESSTSYIKQLREYFKDPEIKAILLKIDSGGGAAGSSQAIAIEINNLKSQYPKPIVSYSENLCASGAYLIASVTDHIIATPSSIIGNIGSKLATQFKCKRLLEDYKVQTYNFAAGNQKDVLNPFVDMSEQGEQMLQKLTDDCYIQFTEDVAKYRRLSLQNKDVWANGNIFSGTQALHLKLIDTIGNLSSAVDYIKQNILHSDREVKFIKQATPSPLQKWLHPQDDEYDDNVECNLSESFFTGLFNALKKAARY